MASRTATVAAKNEIKAVAKKNTTSKKPTPKIYRSRGSAGRFHRITVFVSTDGYSPAEDLRYWFEENSEYNYDGIRDFVISDVEISKDDFDLVFEA